MKGCGMGLRAKLRCLHFKYEIKHSIVPYIQVSVHLAGMIQILVSGIGWASLWYFVYLLITFSELESVFWIEEDNSAFYREDFVYYKRKDTENSAWTYAAELRGAYFDHLFYSHTRDKLKVFLKNDFPLSPGDWKQLDSYPVKLIEYLPEDVPEEEKKEILKEGL